jgi:hypothetical protein
VTRIRALIIAAALAATLPAHAMTTREVELTCPYDGKKFKFREQGSGTSFDKTLDLMPYGAIRSPWPIAVCPTNGFVFYKNKFEPAELKRLKPIVLSAEYQALKDETPYYRAAWITQRDGASNSSVGVLLLRATWEAAQSELHRLYEARPANAPEVDFKAFMAQGNTSERYRRYATELLAKLDADIAEKPDSVTPKILKGELLRRLGRFEEAEAHFKEMSDGLEAGSTPARVVAFQRELIAKRDIGIRFMSEVPKAPKQ